MRFQVFCEWGCPGTFVERQIGDFILGLVGDVHHNLLLAKACPEPDLRYRSNSTAFDSSLLIV